MNKPSDPKSSIKVTVTFPLAGQPYQDEVPQGTTAGAVRSAAMSGFGVTEDPSLVFYLVHAGDRVPDDRPIGDIAGSASAVKFTLTREIIQG